MNLLKLLKDKSIRNNQKKMKNMVDFPRRSWKKPRDLLIRRGAKRFRMPVSPRKDILEKLRRPLIQPMLSFRSWMLVILKGADLS